CLEKRGYRHSGRDGGKESGGIYQAIVDVEMLVPKQFSNSKADNCVKHRLRTCQSEYQNHVENVVDLRGEEPKSAKKRICRKADNETVLNTKNISVNTSS
ncbi:hypothetical protein RRG08_062491, partial [Elysia crispata]